MFKKLNVVFLILFAHSTSLLADEGFCYQKPDKCATGDIIILTISEDVAKYCDFDKQIIGMTRHTTSRSFNNQEVVCVKVSVPRVKKK